MTAVLYAALGQNSTTSDLYSVDPSTGAVTSIGPIGFAVTGLAYDKVGLVMYGATSANSAAHPRALITIDLTTGAGTFVGNFGAGQGDIACDPAGNLFGYNAQSPYNITSINKSTGAATNIGAGGPSSFGEGMSFDSAGVLYSMPYGDTGDLITIDPATGNRTTVATLSAAPPGGQMLAAAFDSLDVLWAIDGSRLSFTYLVTVDTTTAAISTIGMTIDKLDALEWVGVSSPTLRPSGIASAEAFGTPTLTQALIVPTGIASGEVFGTPTLTAPSSQTLSPSGFDGSGAMGTPTVADVGTYTIYPTGIP